MLHAASTTPVSVGSFAMPDTCCINNRGLFVFSATWLPAECASGPAGGVPFSGTALGLTSSACDPVQLAAAAAAFQANPRWNAHGLWPDECDGTYKTAQYCDAGFLPPSSLPSSQYGNPGWYSFANYSSWDASYVPTVLQAVSANATLWGIMNSSWIGSNPVTPQSPSGYGGNLIFWAHEYAKHGSCISTIQPACNGGSKVQAVGDYLSSVVQFNSQFNWYSILAAQGILPSNTPISLASISAAVFNTFGHTVSFYCSGNAGPDGQSKYLREIWSYFMANQGSTGYFMVDTASTQTTSCSPMVYYQPFTFPPPPPVLPTPPPPPPLPVKTPTSSAAAPPNSLALLASAALLIVGLGALW